MNRKILMGLATLVCFVIVVIPHVSLNTASFLFFNRPKLHKN